MIDIHLKTDLVVLPHQIELSPLFRTVEIEDEIGVPRVTKIHGDDIGRIIYRERNSANIRPADDVFEIDDFFNLAIFPSQNLSFVTFLKEISLPDFSPQNSRIPWVKA